jgi:4-hydroxybenzoate polyprenyltransferase
VFTAWADILAAHIIVTGGAPQFASLVLLLLATSCLYWAGMVLNDCFDLAVDRRERPGRPLPSGRVPMHRAWLLGWSLLVLGVLAAGLVGTRQLLIAVLIALAVVAYDGWLKRYAVGALSMGLCRYLNWLLGLSVLPLGPESHALAAPALIYVTALTLLSRAEVQAGDRRVLPLTGLTVAFAAIWIGALYLAGVLPAGWALLLLAPALGAVASALRRAWLDFTPTRVQATVRLMILGIVVLDALLVAAAGHPIGALLVLALLIPGRVLARRIPVT